MIYLDNQATTPLDPQALEAMLPLLRDQFANPGSSSHAMGREVADRVARAVEDLAACLGAQADEIVLTSGATESNNLALQGVMHHPRQKRCKVIGLQTEHKAILDPLDRLQQQGFEVQRLPVLPQSSSRPGLVDMRLIDQAIDGQTALVTVMLANNEIGTIQPLREIAEICRQRGAWLHSDASQAVGKIQVDVDQLDVDLLSFSAHKFYGPKGVGGLYVRRRERNVRLQSQIVGGGQQHNLRSGTLNSAGIVGMSVALKQTLAELTQQQRREQQMRDRLFAILQQQTGAELNGPALDGGGRLAGNLNCCFHPIEGQSMMLLMPDLAISSGSACTSANPQPSHVLQAIGLSEDQARCSLRFGIGRFNQPQQIDQAAQVLLEAWQTLKRQYS